MRKAKLMKRSKGDIIFDAVIFVILTVIFLIVAYPLYFIIISSFSDPAAVAGGMVVWIPIKPNLRGYEEVFRNNAVVRGFLNSLLYTSVGTLLNLVVTLPTAFALSRKEFQGNRFVTVFYLITMFVNGGMIPTYLVVKSVKFLDTIWALIVPGALGVYNMFICRTYFKTNLPNELIEAAKLDGCGNTRFFVSIALPLSGALIAIMVLYYGIGHWNSYFSALLYISDKNKFPLQLVLRSILIQNEAQLAQQGVSTAQQLKEQARRRELVELMKYSLIIVSSIPVMIIYPIIQKYFVKGVLIGSVKG
ncbi:MAG TPA: carbohydrate ABC transporter permease [Clostridiales bacterium]|nr:carbohydrate ABC transporter permease [Clostridiales bacterium]